MRTNNYSSGTRVGKLKKQLRQLNPEHPDYRNRRMKLMKDIQLAKANQPKSQKGTSNQSGRVRSRSKTSGTKKKTTSSSSTSSIKSESASAGKKGKGLSGLLSSENIQESLKQVNNLRGLVKNGLGYLQQADSLLETLYATSNSLKDTGVLDKLIKQKGKNLTTEDFTNILVALMNSPVGGQLLGGGKSSDDKTDTTQTKNDTSTAQNTTRVQPGATNQGMNANGAQGYNQGPPQQGYPQGQAGQQGYPQPGPMQQAPQGPYPQQQPQQPQQPQQAPQQQPQPGGNPNQPPMGPYPPYNQGIPGPMQQPQPPQTPPQQ